MTKNNNENKNNRTAIYSIFTILVFLLLITVAGTKIIQDRKENDKLSQLENSKYEDLGRDNENIADEAANANAGADENKTAKTSAQTAKTPTVTLDNISNPVSKTEITMAYSYNKQPVYSITLNEFRSDHMGADISAEIGENVKAAMDGKIEKVYDDGKLGKCVVINHGNNIKTVYANLDDNVSVKAGTSVKKGAVIGKVGKTAKFEIEDKPHLHFEIWQNGKTIDPAKYIK